MRIRSFASLVTVTVVGTLAALPLPVGAKPTPARKCSAAKAKAVGADASAQMGCVRQAVLAGTAVSQACLQGADAKLASAFEKAETKAHGACPTTGDAGAFQALVDALTAGAIAALPQGASTTTTVPTGTTTTTITIGPCFQGATAPVISQWVDLQNQSLTSFAAGTSLCQDSGWDHYCDYTELLKAESQGEFATVPDVTTGWVNRTTTAQVNNQPSAPGAGGNCDNWLYVGNIYADGEYVTFASGVPTYHLDNDTIFDPQNPLVHEIQGDLDCGGVSRSILCCAATCVP